MNPPTSVNENSPVKFSYADGTSEISGQPRQITTSDQTQTLSSPGQAGQPAKHPEVAATRKNSIDIVVIAASARETDPLMQVLMELSASFPVPVLVTIEGMQAKYTQYLVEQLTEFCKLPVHVAEHDRPVPLGVSVATGGQQLVVQRQDECARMFLKSVPQNAESGFATGVLFTSAAIAFESGVMGVVLAGTERTCIGGCKMVRWKGGKLIIQTRQSSARAATMWTFSDPKLPSRCLRVEDIAQAINHSV